MSKSQLKRLAIQKGTTVRLCRDCKYFTENPIPGDSQCLHPGNVITYPDYVLGVKPKVTYVYYGAHYLRTSENRCGAGAKWFDGKRTDD